MRIILSSNKIQLLQREQFVNYFVKLRPRSKNMENMHFSLADQIAHIFRC